jgi:hypothetical protein
MNILFSILDIVQTLVVWSMGLILGRQPQPAEAFRLLFVLASTSISTWLFFYWRDLARKSRRLRRRLEPDERYSGLYLQAIQRGEGIRYAILKISYVSRKRRFEVYGRIYDPGGNELSAFRSHYVFFPTEESEVIEFAWKGRRAASGFTCMKVENRDGDYIEGSGYVIAFGANPKTFPVLFKRLFNADVHEVLGVSVPSQPGEDAAFIRSFHDRLGEKVRHSFENTAEEVP